MNYFEVFNLPVSFKINEKALLQTYLKKQSLVHPDVQNSRTAESAELNAAYGTLIDPLERAKHFLEILEKTTETLAPEFAAEAFDLREKYESLESAEDKIKFQKKLAEKISALIDSLYDLENDVEQFQKLFGLSRFLNSFLEKVRSDVYDWD